jgi:endonuclease/exonuclease/phosphatase family metal-dependent hydrolase
MKKIRVGTFNVNNLFERPKVMELEGFSDTGKEVLQDVSRLNELLEKESYAGATGDEIVKILNKYFHEQATNEWFFINEIKEKLFGRRGDGSGVFLKVKGRKEWLGWVELYKKQTNEISVQNTARVVKAVDADVLCVVEVDNRIALKRFNEYLLGAENVEYESSMVIDGNDERGIDVGVLSRMPICNIKSHIDDKFKSSNGQFYKIFSRDCPEYKIDLGDGQFLHLLCNHLKSKGYGSQTSNDAKRKRQANRIVEILKDYDLTKDFVVVAGDFNDTPASEPLKKLLTLPNLKDVLDSPKFSGDRWTYHTGKQQIDYVLVSQPIFDSLKKVVIERRGIFRKNNVPFPQVTNKVTQASDHAAIWAEFEI